MDAPSAWPWFYIMPAPSLRLAADPVEVRFQRAVPDYAAVLIPCVNAGPLQSELCESLWLVRPASFSDPQSPRLDIGGIAEMLTGHAPKPFLARSHGEISRWPVYPESHHDVRGQK